MAGRVLSGVVVATIIKSISFLFIPEVEIAYLAALYAKSDVYCSFDAK